MRCPATDALSLVCLGHKRPSDCPLFVGAGLGMVWAPALVPCIVRDHKHLAIEDSALLASDDFDQSRRRIAAETISPMRSC